MEIGCNDKIKPNEKIIVDCFVCEKFVANKKRGDIKMKKKLLSMMIAAAMTASFVALPVRAAEINYKDWSNVWWTTEDDGVSEIPSQYSFTLDDDVKDAWEKTPIYQLIDTEEVNGKKNMLIIRLETQAARGRIAPDSAQVYDPAVQGTLAYWVDKIWTGTEPDDNNSYYGDFASNANSVISVKGSLLNKKFSDYLVQHDWIIEKCSAAATEQRIISAKAVIPSASEIDCYVKKIDGASLSQGNGLNASLTRTPKRCINGAYDNVYAQGETDGKLCMQLLKVNSTDAKRAWGMFWVSEDFFKNVKLSSMGEDVVNEVKNLNTLSDLYNIGYTADELAKMGLIESVNVSISADKTVPGYTITAVTDKEVTDIKWYAADEEDGEYTVIDGVSGNNWTITNAYAKKYVKVCADGFYSNTLAIGEGLRAFNPDLHGGWGLPGGMPQTSPEEYKFTLANPSRAGYTYHMLETEDVNGQSHYFILQMGDMISNGKMIPNSESSAFDPQIQYSAADWLNNIWAVSSNPNQSDYYKSNGGILNNNGSPIDTNIKPYIQSHTWLTERSGGSLVSDDYIFTGKVALLSVTELFKHADKIGKADYGSGWLRTPTESNGKERFYILNINNDVWAKVPGSTDVNHMYRPVYYLSEDFFKNVKLESIGAEAAKMVRETITKQEMFQGKAGYTDEELISIFGYAKDINDYNEAAVIVGDTSVGQRVVARFGGVKEGSIYQWYVADSKDGEYREIQHATSYSYTITENELGKYLAVVVTAFDGEGNLMAPICGKAAGAVGAEKDLTVNFVSLKDSNGGILENVFGVTGIIATFNIKNKSESAAPVTLIVAIYDNTGNLVALNTNEVSAAGENTYSVSLTKIDASKQYSCKVMAWDGLNSMLALCSDERF